MKSPLLVMTHTKRVKRIKKTIKELRFKIKKLEGEMSLSLRNQQEALAEIIFLSKIPDVQHYAWEKQSNIPAIKGALHSQGGGLGGL